MEKEICITEKYVKKMYNELLKEIKKDEYNYTYAWYGWSPIILNDNIESSIHFSQQTSKISYTEKLSGIKQALAKENKAGNKYIITYYEDYDEYVFELDDVKKIMVGIVDFEKLEKLEDESGAIYRISLQELLNKNIILNKDRFLKIYLKIHNACLLKNLDLKNISIDDMIMIYDDLIANNKSFFVKYFDDIQAEDLTKKHL